MNLFYSGNINNEKTQIVLTNQEHTHLSKVLRKSTGDLINVTDGLGYIYKCRIDEIVKGSTTLSVLNFYHDNIEYPQLTIAISITKKISRFEWFLEKATEIGVYSIIPIISQHSEKSRLNFDRCTKILVSAMKQSLRTRLPILNAPIGFNDYIKRTAEIDKKFIATCKADNPVLLKNELKKGLSTEILIGPEGGFSEKEISNAKNTNFTPISLGPSRLRTETAGVSACMIYSIINS